jgi:hypothetical protein
MNGPNSSRRRLPSGLQGPLYSGGKHGYLHEVKVEESAARTEARSKRSPAEQVALLDLRLGVGVGATKERARLLALVS